MTSTPADLKYWVAFNRINGLGPVRYTALLNSFGTLEDAWRAGASDLRAAGLDRRTISVIQEDREKIDPDAEIEQLEAAGVRALSWDDAEYPARLREADDAPPVLYVKGDLSPANGWSLSVVGTRRPTPYGRQVAEELSTHLAANGVCIVSGLARGVDAVAHRAALQSGGKTVAVMASGPNIVYPPEHAKLAREISESGALISEHPLGVKPRGDFFPRRNRILSGISPRDACHRGGHQERRADHRRFALDQNREVFAVPGSVFSPQSRGTNTIIARGEAKLVLRVEDILEELNLTIVPQQIEMQELIPATDTEADLLRHISREPVHIDEVCRESGLPVATVSSLLAMMELKGLVRQAGPMAYIRATPPEDQPHFRRLEAGSVGKEKCNASRRR